MKIINRFLLAVVLACCTFITNAQVLSCGVNANWGYTINPNHVHVFTDSSTVTPGTVWQITNHYWNFGDGSTSNLTNPTHQYTNPGMYTVCEYVIGSYNNGGTTVTCIDTFCHQVSNCDGMVQATFTSNVSGTTVVFTGTGTSNYPPLSFSWYFPGGSPATSTTATTTVVYTTPGVHQACLTVTDANGCSATYCGNVTTTASACGNLDASFTAQTTSGTVALSSTSTGTGSSTLYQWWMDGTALTNPNPNTGYTVSGVSSGNHTFCLYVYANQNTFCDSACQTVSVTSSQPCSNTVANFTYTLNGNTLSLNAGTAYPTGTKFQWWLDGTASAMAPTYSQYSYSNVSYGTHNVCLYVYAANSTAFCDSMCVTINVTSCGVNSGFQTATNGNVVTFYQASNATGIHSYWKFGDGTTGSDTSSSFTHTYPSNPNTTTYVICHYVYMPGINCVDSTCQYVVIPGSSVPCGTASFTSTQTSGHLVLTSTSTGTGLATQFVWVISSSNGTAVQTGTGTPFTTTTLPNGYYNVCLYIYNTNQALCDSECHYIPVTSNNTCSGLSAQFTQTYNSNNSVHFISANQMNGAVYHWDFGDGQISTAADPTHSYANAGLYTVCLVVEIPGTVCRDTSCHNVQANAGTTCTAQASITTSVNSNGGYGLTANYGGTIVSTYLWSNGSTTHDIVVTAPGTYCVTATDINGCSGTACATVGSNTCNITAAFTYTINGQVGAFTPASNNVSVNGYWNFGDGTTATSTGNANITHTFPASANTVTYTVCHYVYVSGTNCSVSSCQQITIPGTGSNCGVASFTSTIANGHIYATSTSTNTTANSHYYWTVTGANGNLIQTQSGTNTGFATQILPAGTYVVCLYLYGSSSTQFCDSACQTITITSSTNPCNSLNADWTSTVLSTGGIQFHPVVNTTNVYSYWSFGDGSTSNNYDPIHAYATSGTYTVCHILTIPGNVCADTSCQTITVASANPCIGFSVHINSSTNSNGAQGLEAVISGGGNTHYYHWSNGATTSAIYPTTAGIYCVTAYDNNQCSADDCDTILPNTTTCHAQFAYTYANCNTIQFTNTSSGGYTNQQWYFGDGTSSSAANPVHTFSAGTWTVQLTVYSSGTNCQSSYYAVVTVQPCGVYDTICGVIFNDVNGNGVQDNGEQGMNGGTVYASNQSHVAVNANGEYVIVLPVGTYTLYYCAPSGYSFTIPVGTPNPNGGTLSNCATYTVTTSGGHHCGYNFGLQNNTTTICGRVYNDANNNGQYDIGETGIGNVHVEITSSTGTIFHAYTNANGEYCITVPAGTYTIHVVTTNSLGVVTPQVITIATTNGNSYSNNNFGVYYQTSGACNLSIEITPHTCVTAGFPAWYDIQVCNVGSTTSGGTVNMFFDPALTFNYAQPAQTSVNNSTHTVSWNVTGLAPGSCQFYYVSLSAPTGIQIGQHIFTLASVTTNGCNDANLLNNVDTTHQAATGSWDPNNKLVFPMGEGVEGKILGTEELTYVVNFQNTGNAPAVNVVVRDLIDDDLDLETFQMLGSSHPYTMQFIGREAVWKFNAIMLPDSNTNEAASHGYVSFAIKPNVGLAQGTQLTNTANIYFDYNDGVATNTTLNTIDYALSVQDLENGKVTIALMPNPFKDFTTIKVEGENASYNLKVYDMLGQLIRTDVTANNIFTIQRETLAAGVYMYEVLKGTKLIGKGKMIAE